MKRYLYDPKTKKYLNEVTLTVDIEESRKQNKTVYIIPENSTDIEPPELNDNQILKFTGTGWIALTQLSGKKPEHKQYKANALEHLESAFNVALQQYVKINDFYFTFDMIEDMRKVGETYEKEIIDIDKKLELNRLLETKLIENNIDARPVLKKQVELNLKRRALLQKTLTVNVIYTLIPDTKYFPLLITYDEFLFYYKSLISRYNHIVNSKVATYNIIKKSKTDKEIDLAIQNFLVSLKV